MKSFIPYSLLLATAACGVAYGVTSTAFTVPVGYTTLTVPANTDTNITLPLQTTTTWAGASIGISSNTISVAANSYTASQFGSGINILQVTSGVLVGREFPVLSNGTGNVTVDPVGSSSLQTQGFVGTGATPDTFVIRPYWTLNTLFPNGAGIGTSSDPFSPTTQLLTHDNLSSGIDRGAAKFFFYYNGSAGGTAGWYDETLSATVNDRILSDSETLTARNNTASPLTLTNQGTVRSVSAATLVIADTVENDTYMQLPFAVNTSLAQTRLFESGAVAASSDPFSPTDRVLIFDSAATGFDPGASNVFFYYDGSLGGAVGWYDQTLTLVTTDLVLKAGSTIIVRKPAAASLSAFTWTAPLPYTL